MKPQIWENHKKGLVGLHSNTTDLISPPLPALKTLKTPLHEALGVSPEYTRRQYMKIVHQDENLPAKLKAIAPLARELGLEADPELAQHTQNIIIMMPQEIATKHELVRDITET